MELAGVRELIHVRNSDQNWTQLGSQLESPLLKPERSTQSPKLSDHPACISHLARPDDRSAVPLGESERGRYRKHEQ